MSRSRRLRPGLTLTAAFAALAAAGACASGPETPGRDGARAPAAPWRYDVTLEPDGRLSVVATFPADSSTELGVDRAVEPFVDRVARAAGPEGDPRWEPVPRRNGRWILADDDRPRRVRFTVDLASLAGTSDPRAITSAAARGDDEGWAWLAPPSTWLLRPLGGPPGAPVTLAVRTPPGTAFVSGVAPHPGDPGARRFDADAIGRLSFTALGAMTVRQIELGGGAVTIAILPGERRMTDDEIVAWVEGGLRALVAFYGRLPVGHAAVIVDPGAPDGLIARARGGEGASVYLPIGSRSTLASLADDWTLVHELVHLACPEVDRRHHWLEEGLATYVEPIARVLAGDLEVEDHWRDLIEGLPQGLPEAGDRGLDRTATWGRTYWGGALFCLLADVEIRERTGNAKGLRDALRAVIDEGGSIASFWRMEQLLRVADDGAGTDVLRGLWERTRHDPHPVDLDELFARLGVRLDRGRVVFDDDAPLAAIRRAMTATE